MMKLYRNIFLTLFTCLLLVQSSYAITEKKQKTKDVKQNAAIEYNNDMHSTFSLKDCVSIAIEHNPRIRSYIYNEQVYKSK